MVFKLLFLGKSDKAYAAIALAVFFFGLLVIGSVAMPRANAAPSITLSPTSGPPGTTVHVYGSGFTANGEINSELWNGTSAYNFSADGNGNLNTTVTVPTVEAGLYGFTITDQSTGSSTQTQCTVTQSSTAPTPTPTASTSASHSPAPTATPEFPPLLAVVAVFTAGSAAAFLIVRKRKTSN